MMSLRSANSDKPTWLANQILSAFPQEVTGLKFFTLDCGCIYYPRVFRDGDLDPHAGIYRDAECNTQWGQTYPFDKGRFFAIFTMSFPSFVSFFA